MLLLEEIKGGKPGDLPALFYQLNQQYSMADKFSRPSKRPDRLSPYFGFMGLEEKGKIRNIFLGHSSFIDSKSNYRIVDWKAAPIAQIYFNFAEGDQFELELPERTIEGILKEKAVLTIINRK